MGWACPSSGGHLLREGLEQEGGSEPGLTPGFSAPPNPSSQNLQGEGGPQPVWWKGHPPTETGQPGVTQEAERVLQDRDAPPSSPRSCSGEGRGAGRQSCAGWRGGAV